MSIPWRSEDRHIFSVTELNREVRGYLTAHPGLRNVWVTGEVSNLKDHPSGHLYLTLKDAGAAVRCVMFRRFRQHLRYVPANGERVMVRAAVDLFERDGQYQLYIEALEADGWGERFRQLEELRERLRKEGLFDTARKRRLPLLPRAVAVVTGSSGAVIHDIRKVVGRRFPRFPLVLFPALVQGDEAPGSLVAAIAAANEHPTAEVIIVARGGGSAEDLWAFQDERVVRAVAASRLPVVAAIGHESDTTLTDLAADLRAPTPSAAAEVVVPEKRHLEDQIQGLTLRLERALRRNWERRAQRLHDLTSRPALADPARLLSGHSQRLDRAREWLIASMKQIVERSGHRLQHQAALLDGLSPLATLQRGYAIASDASGRAVRTVASLRPGDRLHVRVVDGEVDCRVEATHLRNEQMRDERDASESD